MRYHVRVRRIRTPHVVVAALRPLGLDARADRRRAAAVELRERRAAAGMAVPVDGLHDRLRTLRTRKAESWAGGEGGGTDEDGDHVDCLWHEERVL